MFLEKNKKQSLLLLPGICSTGKVFSSVFGPGLIQLLKADFNLHVGELLGSNLAAKEEPRNFDKHLQIDLPIIWKYTVQRFGLPLGVLGYSMGGMLALAGTALRVITPSWLIVVGSPCCFREIPFYPPLMKFGYKLAVLIKLKRVPIRLAARIIFWIFAFKKRKISPGLRLFHALVKQCSADVSIETLAQAISWIESGMFCDAARKFNYLDYFENITVPVLFIAGERDHIAPPESVKLGFEKVKSQKRNFVVVQGAGHLNLVTGIYVRQVVQIVKKWLSTVQL